MVLSHSLVSNSTCPFSAIKAKNQTASFTSRRARKTFVHQRVDCHEFDVLLFVVFSLVLRGNSRIHSSSLYLTGANIDVWCLFVGAKSDNWLSLRHPTDNITSREVRQTHSPINKCVDLRFRLSASYPPLYAELLYIPSMSGWHAAGQPSQLKMDAQSRQIKRQEEDLATLREERELQLVRISSTVRPTHLLISTTCTHAIPAINQLRGTISLLQYVRCSV